MKYTYVIKYIYNFLAWTEEGKNYLLDFLISPVLQRRSRLPEKKTFGTGTGTVEWILKKERACF
jgi:hypothetical protein